jgi:branched-chain amino acid transport system substrate-binding protein
MTKKLSVTFKAVALVVLAAATLIVLQSCNEKGSGADVKVASNLPMTGDLATYGGAVRDGANMAREDLEKAEPSSPKLIFDWQDNTGDPKAAVSIMQKQYLNLPDVYVSGVKPQTMAIKDQVSAKGTPHFVWIFDAFINPGSQNNFRTWVSYKIEPPVYLEYASSKKAKRVAIIYVQLPHTVEEFERLVVPGLRQRGADQLLVEPFDFGKKDFKDIAVKVRDFKPDLIILNGFQAELVGLVRSLRPFNLITDGNTIATYDMLDAATILGADELEGIRIVAPVFVTRPDRDKVKTWREQFKAKYNKEPLYTHAFSYDMALILHDAAKRLKLPATSPQWIEALRSTNMEGITGPLKFDQDGDLLTPLEVGVYRNGRLVPATAEEAPKAMGASAR